MAVIESEHVDAVVIGAGVAGLTAAAELSVRNMSTLVVERHSVPGGCASFFQHDGYRFDVGATLLSGYAARGIHRILNARYHIPVSTTPVEPAMLVHLPDKIVTRYGDERWRGERLRAFGPEAETFFARQESIADRAWDLASRLAGPPRDLSGALRLARAIRPRNLPLVAMLGKTVSSLFGASPSRELRTFVDAQLLITAQTGAAQADLAYGCTALDIAREGTVHLADGASTIASGLVRAIRRAGSRVRFGAEVSGIEAERGRVEGVVLADGRRIAARTVIAALPAHDLAGLHPALFDYYRPRLAALPERWGAFALYCGLPPGAVPDDFPLHHQLIASYDLPLGEGNTAFLSFSDAGNVRRARNGGRAVTLSTHTDVARWERAFADGTYDALRERYRALMLAALARVLPGAEPLLTLAATPHTFAHYTGRRRGLVGGLPQTRYAALRAFSHRTPLAGLYLAGDTAFPGQSTVGASLSGYLAACAASP